MTQAAIGADFHEPFDIERDLLTKITLNGMLFLDDLTDLIYLFFVQFANLRIGRNSSRSEDVVRLRPADTIDVREADFNSLVRRKIYASNTCHALPLSLLVLGIHANNAYDALAMHNLAFVTNLLYGCPDFHNLSHSLYAIALALRLICTGTRSGHASDRTAKAQLRLCLREECE
jgi:hypothetical protein